MPKTILFIEDESALQKTFGEILKQEGYEMISALDGEVGLRLAKDKKPDLILLDLILPRIHGFEVLKKLIEHPKTIEGMKDFKRDIVLEYQKISGVRK